jgi:uncharacterized cysteine cluster protein YcgN (CxxCxxCC family)
MRAVLPDPVRGRGDGEIIPTRVSCQLLDQISCQCKDYANRKATVPDCIKLDPYNIEKLPWMPRSCAYRRLHEGKPLPALASADDGDRESPHAAGSASGARP